MPLRAKNLLPLTAPGLPGTAEYIRNAAVCFNFLTVLFVFLWPPLCVLPGWHICPLFLGFQHSWNHIKIDGYYNQTFVETQSPSKRSVARRVTAKEG